MLATVFEKTEAVAKKLDEIGFETLWLAEHHFQHEGYEVLPNLLMMAVHLSHVTKRLKPANWRCGITTNIRHPGDGRGPDAAQRTPRQPHAVSSHLAHIGAAQAEKLLGPGLRRDDERREASVSSRTMP